jgi:hypothetical protein
MTALAQGAFGENRGFIGVPANGSTPNCIASESFKASAATLSRQRQQ